MAGGTHRTVRVPFAALVHATARWSEDECLADVVADLKRGGMARSLVVSDLGEGGYELRLVRLDAGVASVTLAPAPIAAYRSGGTWSPCAVSVAAAKADAVRTFLAFNA